MTGAPPRVLLDACVLVPSILREILIGAARARAFTPLWSPRILEEWARATRRLPEGAEATARIEIALLRADWPTAEVAPTDAALATTAALHLPDPDDAHVIAAALAAGADTLLTLNLADFPTRLLTPLGLQPRDPDGFLTELAHAGLDMAAIVAPVRAKAEAIAGTQRPARAFLRKAGLPRLGKLLG